MQQNYHFYDTLIVLRRIFEGWKSYSPFIFYISFLQKEEKPVKVLKDIRVSKLWHVWGYLAH